MDLLLAALLLALTVWGFRKVRAQVVASRARRDRAAKPGASPDNPILLRSAQLLEDARAAQRCDCGGRVLALGETSRLGLRVARGRCVECDADVDLYFTLPELLN
jgi:hypothetical protein